MVASLLVVQALGVAGPLVMSARAAPVDLRVGFLETIDSLNPFRAENDPAYVWMGLVYDFLFSLDQDGNLVPNLAVDASCDATCQNWTYQIRSGVRWHDGTPLTADDVAFTYNYNIENFGQLWAFEPYVNHIRQCTAQTEPTCGAKVTSPGNVTIYFDLPFVPGKAMFVPILQKAQWAGIPVSQAQTKFNNENPIGTGPFYADINIFNQWSTGDPLLMHKYPYYHPVGGRSGPATIDNIYLQHFGDENSLVLALRAGSIDLAKMTPSGYRSLEGVANIERQEGLPVTQYSLEVGFTQIFSPDVNGKLNPARWDEQVRRALAMATNKDYIISTIYQGKGVRGTSVVSPVTPQWFYDPTKETGVNLTYDEAAANALLDAAGYTTRTPTPGIPAPGLRSAARALTFTNTNGVVVTVPAGTSLVFTVATRLEFKQEQDTADYLKAQWARLGVQINIKREYEAALSEDVYGAAVEAYIWYWSGDPDPNYLLSVESGFTLDGWNDNYWNNATYNQLYVAQLAARNQAEREQLVLDAQRLHYESGVYITYIYPFGEWAYRTDHFSGWGDWKAHPYRQMDAYWGANPLFLELVPASAPVDNPPTKPLIAGRAAISAFANMSVTFSGTSTDPDPGQNLSWNWNWADGNVTIHLHDTSITQDTASHTWVLPGNYSLTLLVSDGQLSATSDPVLVTVIPSTGTEGWINGTVKDASSVPIAGAAVTTTPGNHQNATVAGGSYSIPVPAGTYSATATALLFAAQTLGSLVVPARGTAWANFTLSSTAGWIAGRVTSSADQAPIAGAAVYATGGGRQGTDLTDAQGRYNITIANGTYSMNAQATGFRTKNATGVVVVTGATTTQDFALDPVAGPATGLSTLIVAAIGLVVIAAAAILVFYLFRRRKKKEGEGRIELPP